jgi:hypothetical protein
VPPEPLYWLLRAVWGGGAVVVPVGRGGGSQQRDIQEDTDMVRAIDFLLRKRHQRKRREAELEAKEACQVGVPPIGVQAPTLAPF